MKLIHGKGGKNTLPIRPNELSFKARFNYTLCSIKLECWLSGRQALIVQLLSHTAAKVCPTVLRFSVQKMYALLGF